MTAEPRSLVGQVFTDASGRMLSIGAVQPGDPLEREIVGIITLQSGEVKQYSTTAATFKEIWIERAPPVSREQQELNRKKMGV